MFDKVKGMYDLQKKARAIQKELKQMTFVAEGKEMTVTVNGAQEMVDIAFEEGVLENANPIKLSKQIVELTNKAFSKAQKASAEKMKSIAGDMGLPF